TYKGKIFIQQPNGKFKQMPEPALELDSMWEAVDAIWVDVNNDKAPDLVIATGGNEYYGQDEHLQPLLYLNDGKGKLTKSTNAFPP
ncbi:FG-GAP repeat domain-containing protein, partial [Klebsiella variicola subsp. variicola]|uniref:FG-GAP repeat domain-containing protein n=1 Tax=Klebsiella variicola TaxID=244366 RepID=UPI003CFEC6C8